MEVSRFLDLIFINPISGWHWLMRYTETEPLESLKGPAHINGL
jgi:hypothetical protein